MRLAVCKRYNYTAMRSRQKLGCAANLHMRNTVHYTFPHCPIPPALRSLPDPSLPLIRQLLGDSFCETASARYQTGSARRNVSLQLVARWYNSGGAAGRQRSPQETRTERRYWVSTSGTTHAGRRRQRPIKTRCRASCPATAWCLTLVSTPAAVEHFEQLYRQRVNLLTSCKTYSSCCSTRCVVFFSLLYTSEHRPRCASLRSMRSAMSALINGRYQRFLPTEVTLHNSHCILSSLTVLYCNAAHYPRLLQPARQHLVARATHAAHTRTENAVLSHPSHCLFIMGLLFPPLLSYHSPRAITARPSARNPPLYVCSAVRVSPKKVYHESIISATLWCVWWSVTKRGRAVIFQLNCAITILLSDGCTLLFVRHGSKLVAVLVLKKVLKSAHNPE